jgi:hypothetical protein
MGSGASTAVNPEARFGLCVGVNGAPGAPLGGTPLRDAEDVATAFRRAGWSVEVVLSPSQAELKAALETWSAKLTADGASMFYFSGHVARDADGVNALVPMEGACRRAKRLL